jgi:hypothetical protein
MMLNAEQHTTTVIPAEAKRRAGIQVSLRWKSSFGAGVPGSRISPFGLSGMTT